MRVSLWGFALRLRVVFLKQEIAEEMCYVDRRSIL